MSITIGRGKIKDRFTNRNAKFYIPIYQRNYDWQPENCKLLIDDMVNFTKDEDYFLGNIVLAERLKNQGEWTENYDIIDGQQRFTTLTLLLLALYKIAKNDEGDIAKGLLPNIKRSLLLEDDNGKPSLILKSTLNDEEDLKKIANSVLNQKPEDLDPKKSNIIVNFNAMYKYINSQPENVNKILETFNKIVVAEIILNGDSINQAQEIFETLNATGVSLSDSDKIRNFLLMDLQGEEQNKAYKTWQKIEENVIESPKDRNTNITDFINHFYIANTQKEVKAKEFYIKFKNEYRGQDKEKILENLLKESEYYKNIMSSQTESKVFNNAAKDLLALKQNVTKPFLLYTYKKYKEGDNKKEIEDFVTFIHHLLVRHALYNESFQGLTKYILIPTMKKIEKQDLKGAYNLCWHTPSNFKPKKDDDIIENLKKLDIYSKEGLAKFVLPKIETSLNTNKEPVDLTNQDITIDHIIPQKLTPEWQTYIQEDNKEEFHKEYIHKLGNLTLLGKNSNKGQKLFAEAKEEIFKNSNLELNKELYKLDDDYFSTRKNIDERSEKLAKIIANIFTIDKPDFVEENQAQERDFTPLEYGKDYQNTKPLGLRIFDKDFDVDVDVKHWSKIFTQIIKEFYENHPQKFNTYIIENENFKEISDISAKFRASKPIETENGKFYVETDNDTNIKIEILNNVAEALDFDLSDIEVKYKHI